MNIDTKLARGDQFWLNPSIVYHTDYSCHCKSDNTFCLIFIIFLQNKTFFLLHLLNGTI